MNKKILALLLAFAMIFSTMTTAFANETATIGADAEALKLMGVLQGDDGGVTSDYLAKETTRMQAAIMYLRLKGLEDEAMAFTGTTNFADANTMTWGEGKAIMAYLKANPQLGWIGADGGKLMPFEKITAQQYYKVILEALGYKQTTAEVVGNFAWSEVMTFAASKGLVKLADNTTFTNNDLAIATIEGLKANMKDSGNTLAVTLVDAGMINKDAAIAAGLYAATTTAIVEEIKVLGNNKILVMFDSAVAKAFAENTANYKIVEKADAAKALEVKAAALDGTDMVVLETAAQTAGKAYTMTVGEVSINFAGVAVDNSAPELEDVVGSDTNRIVVTFDKAMDLATALDAANYTLNNNAKVVSAAWDDDEARTSVELTTENLIANKGYRLTVANVKSIDGVILKSDTQSFTAKSDKKAPVLASVAKDTNTRIILAFTEENDITEASAENIANYSIVTDNTAKAVLEVVSAKLLDKADKAGDSAKEAVVELTTTPQKSGQRYEITVNNLVDTSVLANVMKEEESKTFSGMAADTTEPDIETVSIKTKSMIEIEFDEDSRLDATSALDVNNYSVNNDVTVEKVEFKDADNADELVVRLTVSELGEESAYKVTVNNIADEYGNAMSEAVTRTARYTDAIAKAATIVDVEATSNEEIVITFSKELNSATAEDVANYSIDGGIGTPKSAELGDDDKTVTLTTGQMDGNKEYNVTINGVQDLAGNVMTGVKVAIVVAGSENDTTAPEIDDVVFVNENVVRVIFSEDMNVAVDPTITLSDSKVGEYRVSTDDDDRELEFYFADEFVAADEDNVITITSTTATDIAGNKVVLDGEEVVVDADDLEAADVELLSYDQISVKKFELQYSEKVTVTDATIARAAGVPYSLTISVDEDDATIVYLETSTVMDPDKEQFELELSKHLTNMHGVPVLDADQNEDEEPVTILNISLEDEENPYVEQIVAVNDSEVEITFNEDLDKTTAETKGNYTIIDEDDDAVAIGTATLDGNVVTLALSDELEGGMVYTITVKNVKDVAGNIMDTAEFDFDGTDVVAISNYIKGVSVVNGTTIKVYTNEELDPVSVAVYSGSNEVVSVTAGNDDVFTVAPTDPSNPGFAYVDGETYVARVYYTADKYYSVSFAGIVENDFTVDELDAAAGFEVSYDDDFAAGDVVMYLEGTWKTATITDGVASIPTPDATAVMLIRNNVVLSYAVLGE